MNCSTMSWERRTSRLGAVEALLTSEAPRQGKVSAKRKRVETVSVSTSKRHREDALTNRVEVLTSEFAQIKSLILNLQPREAPSPMLRNSSSGLPVPEEDRLSTAASQSQFREKANEEFLSGRHSNFSHDDSQNTTQGSAEGVEPDQDVVRQALQIALARLSLDTAPTVVAPSSAFFRGTAKML